MSNVLKMGLACAGQLSVPVENGVVCRRSGGWSVLAAIVLFGALETAMGATAVDWHGGTGGTEEAPLDIYDPTNWGGITPSKSYNLNFWVDSLTFLTNSMEDAATVMVADNINPNSGDFVFLGTMYFYTFANNVANETTSVLKKGDWILDYYFQFGYGTNSRIAFTNETGNLTANLAGDAHIARAQGSTVEIVHKAGDWAVTKKHVQVASGSGSTAIIAKEGGNWTVDNNFVICKGSGSTATILHKGGTFTVGGYLSVGDLAGANLATMIISGGTVNSTHSGAYAIVGSQSEGTVVVTNTGVFKATGELLVANNAAGTLTIVDGGKVEAAGSLIFGYNAGGGQGVVNLERGGTLAAQGAYYRNGTSSMATILFNGGTFKAITDNDAFIAAHDRLSVKVTANGGIIDAAGHAITIAEDILEDAASPGGAMTFRGGGSITLLGAYACTGVTTLEVGTAVSVESPNTLAAGFTVTLPSGTETPLVDGEYRLLTLLGDATFDESALTGRVLPERCELRLSKNKKSIYCVYGNPPATWIGGASGSLSDPNGWNKGEVPVSGNCVIGNDAPATLTLGETFKPEAITFPADTALVTIEGPGAITGISAIVNDSPFHHVFNCPVTCTDGITPAITRGENNYMTFAGGITMFNAPKTGGTVMDYWSGSITITTDEAQEYLSSGAKNYATLVPGTTFTFKQGSMDRIWTDVGTTAVVDRLVYYGCARVSNSGWSSVVFDSGNSVVRVGEIRTEKDAVLFHSYAGSDMLGGTIIADKLTCATTVKTGGKFPYPVFMLNCGFVNGSGVSSSSGWNGEGVWAIGPGGLSFPDSEIYNGAHFETSLGVSIEGRPAATLHSFADWTLQAHPNGRGVTALQVGGNNDGYIVIDTSHYTVGDPAYDTATSHTVTLDGRVMGSGAVRIAGNGKVIFSNEYNDFSNGLTIADTATVEVMPGCQPGAGAVSVGSGATLKVPESGTVALGGDLTLADSAVLGFNFTETSVAPVLDVTDKFVTARGTVQIVLSSTDGLCPELGKYNLTSGGSFGGVKVVLAGDAPEWGAKLDVRVDDGDIVLVISGGTLLFLH